MRNVKVKKDELRVIVQMNRNAHRAIFDEAVDGYKEQAIALLEQSIGEIRAGKMKVVAVSLPVPVDHTSDYDRVLRMLDMSIDDELELTEEDFASYVMDDWHWKRQFLTTNAAYSTTARLAL